MKKLVVIALIMALATGAAVYYYATNFEKNFSVKTQAVVVAVKPIAQYAAITQDMVSIKQLAVEGVVGLSASRIEDVLGRVTKDSFVVGEQILLAKLAEKDGKDKTVSYNLQENYRAITVETDEFAGVGGYIKKGDRVDLATVMQNQQETNKPLYSVMVVENVEVLEVGVNPDYLGDKAGQIYNSVTIAVPAQDVLKATYALTVGKCRVLLRSTLDKTILNPAPNTF